MGSKADWQLLIEIEKPLLSLYLYNEILISDN